MAIPSMVQYVVDDSPATLLTVTGQDGRKYQLKMAMLITGVMDSGVTNPLDGLPIFNVQAQVLTQTQRAPDA